MKREDSRSGRVIFPSATGRREEGCMTRTRKRALTRCPSQRGSRASAANEPERANPKLSCVNSVTGVPQIASSPCTKERERRQHLLRRRQCGCGGDSNGMPLFCGDWRVLWVVIKILTGTGVRNRRERVRKRRGKGPVEGKGQAKKTVLTRNLSDVALLLSWKCLHTY